MVKVEWASGYYIGILKIYQGVTQGDPISSKIFNVVVEAVIRRGGGVCGSGGLDRAVQWMSYFFYAGYKLLASTRTEWT